MVSRVLKFLTPFRIILGMSCLALSVLIVSSIVITNVDRYMNSKCGLFCGYIIEKNTYFNPLDYLLVQLSRIFPFDLIFVGVILLYIFITCLYALVKLGIKFLCFNVRFCFNNFPLAFHN